ncbi:4'-phosphopantetheinyl transferase family protein [Variovorax sp. DT-64]|uniref:4'-phosphopantetheinyl transferase family protein n=1 Tax=Variovorax sp. DT-64 TaxID=3396160 RepID=UPI003F540D27
MHEPLPVGIEVYRLDLDLEAELTDVWPLLAPQERARVRCFARRPDQVRFARARAAARLLLAPRLGCRPGDVPLAIAESGKPFVAAPAGAPLFNIAHSGRHALVALAPPRGVRALGVDIEVLQPDLDAELILEAAFTEREGREVRGARDRQEALYRRWVGKEAVLKAIGVGIPLHLKSVGIHPGADHALAIECAVPGWSDVEAVSLAAPPGYAAALAWRAASAAKPCARAASPDLCENQGSSSRSPA